MTPSQIWIHVPFERVDKKTGQTKSTLEMVIEKKSMVNLVQAYSVSVKVCILPTIVPEMKDF